MKIIPTIMSGGAGARLWPVSREAHPKPFIKLADGKSLLQHAFLRAALLPGVEQILTITNRELFFKSEDEYSEVNASGVGCTYLLEPMGRDTAAATAIAALYVQQIYGDDAIILLFPADHMISDLDAFRAAGVQAIELASRGRLVTFGIDPEYPETGYGYIEADGQNVLRFVEKPDLAKAKEYIAAGRFYWNSGMFCFSAGTMIGLMQQHCPDILDQCRRSLVEAHQSNVASGTQLTLDRESFALVPKNSIDYAILEKAENVAMIGCNIGWTDIGSWNALSDLIEPDGSGNRINGDTVLVGTENCFIQSSGDRLVGTVGVQDLVIVDSADAVLVAHKDRAQDVKQLFTQLKANGHEAHSLHRTVHRPWGTYTTLEEGPRFKIKRIEVKPGASLSLQMHHHRSEHWVVVSGTAKVVNGEQELILNTNESTYIPCGHKHRLENPGIMRLVMIEVQSGDYLGEDDIVRFDDVYGRQ
ncbi:mannose-1-phosphate guanylyltransferase/mannose-6-phosphate isomerase [Phyllobacterium endophyticum]|uniref:mannose-1-phosphate guanylyltransferase n=1 Tax=Phyllobacterium endophyticum TaxID=1149773 RepID=A0A2P7AW19_9HYPH|nr:mannose-1-phosphate guanylyltransferase/mannose-6-phosphate isomerase [Phyllobacterium endophyticum]MBB3234974.1 mannose-1-phosphate guanylyltransferase [Phyllobacterium endophyticum]PSH58387.1 mannose-1-phosphate guanylyltransferase/mannose-6-phosphate isomerase [Phyllobacterium endophyticum]TXR47104.1 mannose-1-phosphate guanylyltransferase/mannose-6-phosphate isomerase [Phyllobacterium endophyticum]TYR39058.1 mannose-1-phosphate guanylyltransferase/mannose-6-phosphate isomerase [Phyllobac